jgi:hypothetical protein
MKDKADRIAQLRQDPDFRELVSILKNQESERVDVLCSEGSEPSLSQGDTHEHKQGKDRA